MKRILPLIVMILSLVFAVSGSTGSTGSSDSIGSRSAGFDDAQTTAPRPLPPSRAWGWPVDGKAVVARHFDPPPKPWLSGHRGVDLIAAQGVAVKAPTNGIVTFVGVVVNRAVITITTNAGLRISFEPVVSKLKKGSAVAQGELLGLIEGPTHCGATAPAAGTQTVSVEQATLLPRPGRKTESASGSCLHWGVRSGEEYIDPLQFVFDLRPSILLPLLPGERQLMALTRNADGEHPWVGSTYSAPSLIRQNE